MSRFHYATMTAHLDLGAAQVRAAQSLLGQLGGPPRPQSDAAAQEAIEALALHEHEFFHCRSTLSTTIGWLLFYLGQVAKSSRIDLFTETRGRLRSGPISAWTLNPAAQSAYARLGMAELLWRLFDKPARLWFEMLGETGVAAEPSGLPPAVFSEDYPYLKHVCRPTEYELDEAGRTPAISSILEAQAVWREFTYVSGLALARFHERPDVFYDFTDAICAARLTNLKYRAAADMIFQATGLGLSSVGAGFILDIALCPSVVGPGPVSWAAFHPGSRLLSILRVWPTLDLPSWISQPNYEPIPWDAYERLDDQISQVLGWPTAQANCRALQMHLIESASQASDSIRENAPNFVSLGRQMYELRFVYALGQKLERGAAFIHPAGDYADLEFQGSATEPLITVWRDDLWVNSIVLPQPAIQQAFIADALAHLFLDDFINSSHQAPLNFRLARRLHRLGARWLREMGIENRLLGPTFDQWATRFVGYKWRPREGGAA